VLESLVVAEVVSELDVDVEGSVDVVVTLELVKVLFVCVWARAKYVEENDRRRLSRAIATRRHVASTLPKLATFTPN
jgi:hypothetical protein